MIDRIWIKLYLYAIIKKDRKCVYDSFDVLYALDEIHFHSREICDK